MKSFQSGAIENVEIRSLRKYIDERGWLAETYRIDELEAPYHPVMTYVSQTLPGVTRGPHEHQEQSDLFIFMGPGNFKLYLWDNRSHSKSFETKQVLFAGADHPLSVLIPPGVVHAYKNVSQEPALVINHPNQLFAGKNKAHEIDEIRHEDDPNTPFRVD